MQSAENAACQWLRESMEIKCNFSSQQMTSSPEIDMLPFTHDRANKSHCNLAVITTSSCKQIPRTATKNK